MSDLPLRVRAAAALAVLSAPAAALQASDPDLTVIALPVNQSIQTGSTTLVAGKSTIVRCAIETQGEIPAGAKVDGILRVFVGGVEADWSPVYSLNGPIDVPAISSPGDLATTLNFGLIAPEGSGVEFVAELNPAGPNQLAESDTSNNSFSTGPLTFECVGVPDIVWVPIDYRPGGGTTPNLPNFDLIKPGVGDNFMQGSFPAVDIDYRRSDAPSKLWTSSLSGSGSSLNNSLLMDLQMMNPQPDFIYGWVPGSLPYNGQAIGIPGQAGMGNTDPTRHQRTFAHEVGHLIGLVHTGDKINNFGIDVEGHLNEPLGLAPLMAPSKNDIMVAGQITSSAWIDQGTYNQALNHPAWACAAPFDLADAGPGERLLLAGLMDTATGALDVTHVVAFDGGRATEPADPEQANVFLRAIAGDAVVHELALAVHSSADHCAECRAASEGDADVELPEAGFVAVLPAAIDPARLDRIDFVDAAGELLASVAPSAHAPQVEITSPRAADPLAPTVDLTWKASDADGDALTYWVRYSPDGERMVPVASGLTGTAFELPLDGLPDPQIGRAFVEVLASDGFRTSRAATVGFGTGGLIGFAGGGNAPFVHVLTPDDANSYAFGATVFLHGAGQDLEDGQLNGAALVWTSDLDGVIGTGRVTSVADLSVGSHTITLTGTDLTGQQTSDSVAITITERALPEVGVTCQTDLGFGGPGAASLSVCGGDLSSGTTADVELVGAAPNESLFLGVSTVTTPVALFGGTVVTNPVLTLLVDQTDADGAWTLPGLPGGGGAATFYLQAVYTDAAQPAGFGISNAVQVDFLP